MRRRLRFCAAGAVGCVCVCVCVRRGVCDSSDVRAPRVVDVDGGDPPSDEAHAPLLRERVLENVASVSKGWIVDEEQRRLRLANVNLFLHAIGLDSSQISL